MSMITIEIPVPNVEITKQSILGAKNKTPMSSIYGFIEYEKIPRGIAGIYMFFNINDELLYCGQTISLRSRVREHFYSDNSPIRNHRDEVYKISVIYVPGALDRELYETYIINIGKSKYNIDKVFF